MELPSNVNKPSMWQMFEEEEEDSTWWWGHGTPPSMHVLRGEISPDPAPEILLQAVVTLGAKTADGHIIELVTPAWFKIVEILLASKRAMYELDPRAWEELIAGGYREMGFDVTLTPRSGDRGRDVIATRRDVGAIRFFDQVKALSAGRRVTADDVRALVGVLAIEPNVSKGIVTTTAEFAPGIEKEPGIVALMPYRLELRSGKGLLEWLRDAHRRRGTPAVKTEPTGR
jgi:restriction system protein